MVVCHPLPLALDDAHAQLVALAERLRLAVAVPIAVQDPTARVMASVGLCTAGGPDVTTASQLLDRADAALYAAKAAGRDRWVYAGG